MCLDLEPQAASLFLFKPNFVSLLLTPPVPQPLPHPRRLHHPALARPPLRRTWP